MRDYKEKDLESFIEAYLLDNNHYIKRSSQDYDKKLCMDSALLERFIESTQSQDLQNLKKRVGEDYKKIFLEKVSEQIKNKGIVKALQTFVEVRGIRFHLAFNEPNTESNPKSIENYQQNILSIVRQLHFSSDTSRDSIDMVVFLNGVPLLTIELKNLFTGQNVFDAIAQYKKDRNPTESLFNRCIVHFALDSDLCFMTTKPEKEATRFLPFNQGLNQGSGAIGIQNGAGNPLVEGKMKTTYLWEQILQKDTLLSLLFDFVQIVKKGNQEQIIFPRYHQLDLVTKLLKDCKENGIGGRYLIQHSAGSGKSNSISWLAHHLVSLHKDNKNIFDSIIVVTDRRVLDAQIRENVKAFCNDKNLVEAIKQGSRQLKNALEEGKKIIITTIQKFPYIADEITHLQDKTFAIIIDEAHSSQSGSNAQKLGEVIRDRSNEEMDSEDEILQIIKNKKLQPNASYFAFTATPKPKTLEMFGTSCAINGTQKFIPFHLYSMKQAIEEGFIFDVLRGYTTYKSYYKIISSLENNPHYDKTKAMKKLKAYVESNPATIEKKSQLMIEHFFSYSYKKIGTKAKAMVVTETREKAVRYYFAFKKYLKQHYPNFKAIVAFSDAINVDGELYGESGLNGFLESALKNEFKKDDYRFLIVANKYQTGFDEPLLHTMYVDKKLSGVSAVQTLSRLNRICKNKEDTCVLDFANTHEDIAEAFNAFYEQTYLGEPTNIDRIFDLKTNLNEYRIYTENELNTFVKAILRGEKEDRIHSMLDIMAQRFSQKSDEEKEGFYSKAKTYLKDYSFLAQILPFEDIELEKLYILLKKLISKIIPPKSEDLAMGILDNVDCESYRILLDKTQDIILSGKGELSPSKANGSSKTKESELEELANIVREFNARYGSIDFGESDKVSRILYGIKEDIAKDEMFLDSLWDSDMQNLLIEFNAIFNKKYQNIFNTDLTLYQQLNDNKDFRERIAQAIFNMLRISA